jgi:hypothetical protein
MYYTHTPHHPLTPATATVAPCIQLPTHWQAPTTCDLNVPRLILAGKESQIMFRPRIQPKNKSNQTHLPYQPKQIQSGMSQQYPVCRTNHLRRNICMRHWNQLQPAGQGTVTQFDVYYKALSEVEKEVRGTLRYNTHKATNTHKALQERDVRRARRNGEFIWTA